MPSIAIYAFNCHLCLQLPYSQEDEIRKAAQDKADKDKSSVVYGGGGGPSRPVDRWVALPASACTYLNCLCPATLHLQNIMKHVRFHIFMCNIHLLNQISFAVLFPSEYLIHIFLFWISSLSFFPLLFIFSSEIVGSRTEIEEEEEIETETEKTEREIGIEAAVEGRSPDLA